MFDDVAQRDRLAVGQRVLLHQDVPADCPFSTCLHLVELGRQPCGEELKPARAIHVLFANSLDRPIEGGPIPVVVFADGKEALEVVSGLVQTEGLE